MSVLSLNPRARRVFSLSAQRVDATRLNLPPSALLPRSSPRNERLYPAPILPCPGRQPLVATLPPALVVRPWSALVDHPPGPWSTALDGRQTCIILMPNALVIAFFQRILPKGVVNWSGILFTCPIAAGRTGANSGQPAPHFERATVPQRQSARSDRGTCDRWE